MITETNRPEDDDLPLLLDTDNNPGDASPEADHANSTGGRRKYLLIPVLVLLFALGGIVGLYFQPPGLQLFFRVTGLTPGAGNSNPIAVPANVAEATGAAESPSANSVIALGRLMPGDDIITIAPPFGAGDARIATIMVAEGDFVAQGDIIATLDNENQLRAALENARTSVSVRAAELAQVTATTQANFREAQANYERAAAAAELANQDLDRGVKLRAANQLSVADLERLQSTAKQARSELARADANLSRYAGIEDDQQPDILLAKRNLENARTDLQRAETDLAMAQVVAVADGQVIAINARRGERPGDEGIVTIGNTRRMEVELEVYQKDVPSVAMGQPVQVTSPTLGTQPLRGTVEKVGLEVKRQQLTDDDPAANTDARVVLVRVALDDASSSRAAAYTGLQVMGEIAVTRAQ